MRIVLCARTYELLKSTTATQKTTRTHTRYTYHMYSRRATTTTALYSTAPQLHSSIAFSSKQPSHRIYLLWYYLVKVNVDDGGRRFEVCLKFLSGCANQRVFGLYGLYTFTVFIEFKLANSKTAAGKSQILQKPHASTQRYCKHFHWGKNNSNIHMCMYVTA